MDKLAESNNSNNLPYIKTQKAYEYIRAEILNGSFVPGYRIIINEIARKLNLSNSPVREAIQQLQADGLVKITPYSGAVVQLISEQDYLEAMFVLAVLDGAATSLAAPSMSAEDINELKEINKEMKSALNNFEIEQFGELNKKFHQTCYHRCGNLFLIDRLSSTWQRLSQGRRAGFAFIPSRAKESIKEHDQLIKLIEKHAPAEKIEKFIRQHKLNMISSVRKLSVSIR